MGIQVSDGKPGWGNTNAFSSIVNATRYGYTTDLLLQADGSALADGITSTYDRGTAYAGRIDYFWVPASTDLVPLNASVKFNFEQIFSYNPSFETVGGYNEYALGLYILNENGSQYITEVRNIFSHYGSQELQV